MGSECPDGAAKRVDENAKEHADEVGGWERQWRHTELQATFVTFELDEWGGVALEALRMLGARPGVLYQHQRWRAG